MVAGVGGDAHSVGLIVLSRSLAAAGFRVRYLATQNNVHDLCEAATGGDAVLVSNMDGHAKYYLQEMPHYQEHFAVHDKLWYLGGNPCLSPDDGAIAELRDLGFDRVFPGYVEPGQVIAMLDADLAVARGPEARPRPVAGARRPTWRAGAVMEASDPLADRDMVLSQWHTGASAADLDRNAQELWQATWLSARQDTADAGGRTLIQPRCGVSDASAQRDLMGRLREGGADVLSFQIDSLTRNNAYDEIELVLKEHADPGTPRSLLNGYPAVNHGVEPLRRIAAEFPETPLQVRHSTRDPRLLAEITFASGIAAFEGGPISYNIPYYRNYDPREAIMRWRYVDALAGVYSERYGIVLDREFFGVLTASLVPPCIAVAVNVLEALLAATAGVKSLSLGYAEQGNGPQDVAAIRALGKVTARYLTQRSLSGVRLYTVFHQYMGAFPRDEGKARMLLRGSAATAAASKATRLMLKTYVEAVRIPGAEENVASMSLVREALAIGGSAGGTWAPAADAEEDLIVRESVAIVDAALAAGRGDPGLAIIEGIRQGFIDIPFAPSLWNAGQAVPVRDSGGAVRFASPGAVPLPDDVREFHRDLVAQRIAKEQKPLEELITDDVLRVGRGRFDEWPLR